MTINNKCNKCAYENALEVLAPIFSDKNCITVSYKEALKCYQGLFESHVKKVNQL